MSANKMTADKTWASVTAGSLTTVLVFVLSQSGVEVPPYVAAALVTALGSLLVLVVPNKKRS